MPLSMLLLWLSGLTMGSATSPAQEKAEQGTLVSTRIERRVLKTFDFDERKLGNYEDLPMNWRKIVAPGYPRFLEPRFDDTVGHTLPPSMQMTIRSGSIGAFYVAKDIPVKPTSNYRVIAWVRTRDLVHARAMVSAYFLDHALQKIETSEQWGRPVGGTNENGQWTPVAIDLREGTEDAAWIGLSCHIAQPSEAVHSPGQQRPITLRDVNGAAWFDDITVLRLPKVSLQVGDGGGVCPAGQALECHAAIIDPDGTGLTAQIDIRDVDDHVVAQQAVAIQKNGKAYKPITLNAPAAGWYTARLTIQADETEIANLQRPFIVLNSDCGPTLHSPPNPALTPSPHRSSITTTNSAGGFGLAIQQTDFADRQSIEALLTAAAVKMVKLSLWRTDTQDQEIVRGDPRIERWLEAGRRQGIALTGVLAAPPASLAVTKYGQRRSLTDVLTSPPDSWRPYLGLMLARYGSQIRSWQVGGDDEEPITEGSRRQQVVEQVRTELQPVIGSPDIALRTAVGTASKAAEIPAITLPQEVTSGRLGDWLKNPENARPAPAWVTLQTPVVERYDRQSRLAEYARRLILARCHAAKVFVAQPWSLTKSGNDTFVAPREEFILLRTLSQGLAELEPTCSLELQEGVRAWLFSHPSKNEGVIVAWTDGDSISETKVAIDLGKEMKQVDLWGNVSRLSREPAGTTLQLGPVPVLIGPVPRWQAKFLAGFRVDQPTLQASVEEQRRTIRLTNPLNKRLRGVLRLQGPAEWRINPWSQDVNLGPGESTQLEANFRVPVNQAVGTYTMVGQLLLDDDPPTSITLRALVRVDSPGLDVSVLSRVDGNNLEVTQRITNLSEDSLNLRTSLLAPGTDSGYESLLKIAPAQTAIRRYHLDNAPRLSGRAIRISAHQVDGPLRDNRLIYVK